MLRKKGTLLIILVLSLSFGALIYILSGTGCKPSNTLINIKANQWNINTYSISYIKNQDVQTYSNSINKPGEELVFEAASVGKLVTAYICMKLVNEGKLSLNDCIYPYIEKDLVPKDRRFQDITIRYLLSHTGGFSPSYELGIDKKIYFEPGSKFSYSGVGYIYLQKVIEAVTGKKFEAVARLYVFEPLGMLKSTFEKEDTVIPYVKTKSLVLYINLIWIILSIIFFILGFILGLITKFRYFSRTSLFYISILLGFLLELILLAQVLQRIVLPAFLFGIVGFILLWITKKHSKLRYSIFITYVLFTFLLGSLLPISLPVGKQWFKNDVNAAYSLKTTSKDMSNFAQELMKMYKCKETTVYGEMYKPQIKINSSNSWGLGIAIEVADGQTTYWHSGINPGMQCLFVMSPESNETIIIMANSDDGLTFAKEITKDKLGIDGTWDIQRNK